MSAVIESTERAPGLPPPPPLSRQAREIANFVLSAYTDDETMSVRTVRRLIADAVDMGRSMGAMESLTRARS